MRHGEVFGLLGPNGAGKTTTIRLINTLLPVREGPVEVFGFDVARSPMAARRLMGYVPQMLSIEGALGLGPIARDGVWERVEEMCRDDGDDRIAHYSLHGRSRLAVRPGGAHARGGEAGRRGASPRS